MRLAALLVAALVASPTPDRRLAELATQAQGGVLEGRGGWLYLPGELKHLVAQPEAPPEGAVTPIKAIVDFKRQLDTRGISLLYVAVPPKAAVYPEGLPLGDPIPVEPRLDANDAALMAELAGSGVEVLDLGPSFLAMRSKEQLYCKQDSHWSGAGIALAARLIAERVAARRWLEDTPRRKLQSVSRSVTLEGDLWRALEPPRPPPETLPLRFVGVASGKGIGSMPPDRASPLLLLGDSHALVFSAGGDLHAVGAGLHDQLALEVGVVPDVVAVRGSGATAARVNLLRRRDSLAGKRLVVWVMSSREHTQGRWLKVPVIQDGH